ncbi:hypothetical protein FHX37_4632 [Haloactinospora alba]|uniref:Head-to-tail stopper n=1 Tax=Haloactinospora alba TaxID=405555 RepID=A0A543N2N5_9ACTN|nr:hypothetical protein [Haloactinospora alba]TQN26094.1 hypothetical protein FHX37_4632 [Haloactinospora alba]
MRTIPGWMLRRMGSDVTVEPYQGEGPYGPTYADPVAVRAIVEGKRRMVRGDDGSEVTSETTLRVQLNHADSFPAGSRVTLPDGTQSSVITTSRHDGRTMPVPSHVEVSLT